MKRVSQYFFISTCLFFVSCAHKIDRKTASYDLKRQEKVDFSQQDNGLHSLKFSNLSYDYMLTCESRDALAKIYKGLAPLVKQHQASFIFELNLDYDYSYEEGVRTLLRGNYFAKTLEIVDNNFSFIAKGSCLFFKDERDFEEMPLESKL